MSSSSAAASDEKAAGAANDEKHASTEPKRSKSRTCQWQWPYWLAWLPKAMTLDTAKILFRTTLVAWVTLVYMLIQPVEEWLGLASFLGLLQAFILPPDQPFQIVLEQRLLIALGVALSWAWSVAAMAAANQARGPFDEGSILTQAAQQGLTSPSDLEAYFQKAIFDAQFMDTRATIIIAAFLFVGVFVLAYIRTRNHKYIMFMVFGCISLDIQLSYSPLFPNITPDPPQYALGETVAKPMLLGLVTAVLGAAFIFPQSVNHAYIETLQGVLGPIRALILKQKDILNADPHSDDFAGYGKLLKAERQKSRQAKAKLGVFHGYISREFSFGIFPGKDIEKLGDITQLLARASGFIFYHDIVRENIERLHRVEGSSGTQTPKKVPNAAIESQLLNFESYMSEHRRRIDFKQHLELLKVSCMPLLDVCAESLDLIVNDWKKVNGMRNPFKAQTYAGQLQEVREKRQETLQRLQQAMGKFETERLQVIKPFHDTLGMLDGHPSAYADLPYRGLFLSYHYEYSTVEFARTVVRYLEDLSGLDEERTAPRLWFPFRQIERKVEADSEAEADITNYAEARMDNLGEETFDDEQRRDMMDGDDERGFGPRDPDVLPPTTKLHKVGLALYRLRKLLHGDGIIYAFKTALLTILLAMPSFFPSSASWAYYNRYIWALITATLSLQMRNVGNNISQIFMRIAGTVVGAVYGLLLWEISRGNTYGLAVVCAVGFPFALLWRIKSGYIPASIMATVTVALVVGYSWQDGHLYNIANPGQGVTVFWKRLVMLLIGLGGVFIFTFFPAPHTGTKDLRLTLAACASELGTLHAEVISCFGSDVPESRYKVFLARVLALIARLKAGEARLEFTAFEPPLRGRWPEERYRTLIATQSTMAELLGQLVGVAFRMHPAWRERLMRRSVLLEQKFITDTMTNYYFVSSALWEARPLPSMLPSPMLPRLMQTAPTIEPAVRTKSENQNEPPHPSDPLTLDIVRNKEYMAYCVAVVSALRLTRYLDVLMSETQALVGTTFEVREYHAKAL